MVVTHYGNQQYYGLSSDTKPVPADTAVNAVFEELDTSDQYINNGTSWMLYRSVGTAVSASSTTTFTNKTISAILNPITELGPVIYEVYQDPTASNTIKARNRNNGQVVASHATDLGAVLDTIEATLSVGGSILIRRAAAIYGLNTTVTMTVPRVAIIAEWGARIMPDTGFASDVFLCDAQRFRFINLDIDCSNMNNATGTVFKIGTGGGSQVDRGLLMNNYINNPPIHGIEIGSRTNGVVIAFNRVQSGLSPSGNAISINSCSDHKILCNSIGGMANSSGIAISSAIANIVMGNETFTNKDGISCSNGSDNIIVDNLIQDNRNHGIRVSHTTASNYQSLVISGNRIENNSTLTTNTYNGIELAASSTGTWSGISIANNIITDARAAGTKNQKWGIRIGSDRFINGIILGNAITDNVTGSIDTTNAHISMIVSEDNYEA